VRTGKHGQPTPSIVTRRPSPADVVVAAGARWLARANRCVVPALVGLALAGYILIYAGGLARSPVRSDGFGYYAYLPAVVVHGDPLFERLVADCCGGDFRWYGIQRWPGTGRWVDRYPIGVAVLVAPAYLLAHAVTLWSGMPADGFSLLYVHGAGLSAIVAFGIGLALLRRVLLRLYSPPSVTATLLVVALGTNLVHYATWDPLYSHIYSFALISALLWLVPTWFTDPTTRRSALLGLLAGLIVLVRHPNVIFLLLIPLYGIIGPRDLGPRVRLLAARRWSIVLALVVFGAVLFPQLALYRAATGQWLVSSYGDQWFDFAHPRVAGVLFSVRKGLFFWSPALIGAVAGLFVMRDAARLWRVPATVVLALHTYIVASWWVYGSGYGHRAFTDALAIAALPLGSVLVSAGRRPRLALIVSALAGLAIALSLAQMIQVWLGVMPMHDVTWKQYRRLFLRFR
jgi:hypothetical protein